jgi:glycosyltransferase involved in cell wall biosynthesis
VALRILHAVEFYAPSVGGAQEVVRQISERLAARGHSVTVATTRLPGRHDTRINGVDVAGFNIAGNEVRGMSGDLDAYRQFVAGGDFDVVMTYAAQQWTTDALLPLLGKTETPLVLAPCGFSGLRNPAFRGYFGHLREDLRAFDALIFHSETYQDIEFARAAGAERLHVIPNGADEREFGELASGAFRERHGVAADAPLVMTVGGHTGLKGHAQTITAFRKARQTAPGTLALIGNTPTGRSCLPSCRVRAATANLVGRNRHVALLDPPRAEVLGAYADADLFLFCSQVEASPLVLYEAAAAGLPFVSVGAGNAAEIAEWTGAGVVVPSRPGADGRVRADTQEVVRLVDELLADPERRAEMSAQGRRAWQERFTWDVLAGRYEQLYEGLRR